MWTPRKNQNPVLFLTSFSLELRSQKTKDIRIAVTTIMRALMVVEFGFLTRFKVVLLVNAQNSVI